MPNKWIEHVKKFSKENNIAYGCAISDPKCKASYKKSPIGKEKEKEQNIKDLELQYKEETFTLGGRLQPSRAKASQATNKQYKELTGKNLPSYQEMRKQSNKELERMRKKDNEWYNSEEYKRSQENIKSYVLPTKKKKVSGVLL